MHSVLIVGAGGREHALARAFLKSPQVNRVVIAPGNPGMVMEPLAQSKTLELVAIGVTEIESLAEFVQAEAIDLTFVGSEAPLAEGIVDYFRERHLAIVGPTEAASQLETSKHFAKAMMAQADVPTASYRHFVREAVAEAHDYVNQLDLPIVIKADGLMAGKGVVIAQTIEEAHHAVETMMTDHEQAVVIEECLEGPEFSYFTLVNGESVIPLGFACDYKRASDGDQGPNTGGMGAFSPVSWVNEDLEQQVLDTIVRPMAHQMVEAGHPYTGVLYSGLMLTQQGPKVIEFNARFGDPETQVLLERCKSDFYEVIQAHLAAEGYSVQLSDQTVLGIILAAEGYPGIYPKGMALELPEDVQPYLFAAGIGVDATGNYVSQGGRIAMVIGSGYDLGQARTEAYNRMVTIEADQTFYRQDIGLLREGGPIYA